jgi:hypothetical protein
LITKLWWHNYVYWGYTLSHIVLHFPLSGASRASFLGESIGLNTQVGTIRPGSPRPPISSAQMFKIGCLYRRSLVLQHKKKYRLRERSETPPKYAPRSKSRYLQKQRPVPLECTVRYVKMMSLIVWGVFGSAGNAFLLSKKMQHQTPGL